MAHNRWFHRLLAGTRGQITAELRRGSATISALAERLDLSANAVRAHLGALERDGLVQLDDVQRQGVGKPAHRYRLTADANSLTPKAYDVVLDVALKSIEERDGAAGYAEFLADLAGRLAGNADAGATSFEARLADTRSFLAKIGAEVAVEREADQVRFRGSDCPLASLVGAHPELCELLADVVAHRLGVAVRQCCEHATSVPRCCFEAVVERVA